MHLQLTVSGQVQILRIPTSPNDDVPELSLGGQATALVLLLIGSGAFSMTETVMMAANRYKLRSRAKSGHVGSRLAIGLLDQTDRLLGVILLFNNLINVAAATLSSVITIALFGEDRLALGIGTLLLTFFILVFSEITPKVVGARNADRLAPIISYPLSLLLRVTGFAVSFVNLFVAGLLYLLRLKRQDNGNDGQQLSNEELRSIVLESSQYIPGKHRSILLNLFDLDSVTVEDVMTPRGAIECLHLSSPINMIRQQVATSYHTRLPVLEDDSERIVGVVHLRRLLGEVLSEPLSIETVRRLAVRPYFVPANTSVYEQLHFFQENRQRMALVVDEYGELLGLITLEDIIEELIGKFTTSTPAGSEHRNWGEDGSVLVDGGANLRALNRRLGLSLPTNGPKTLNGLIIEALQEIPEGELSLRIAGVTIEVVQTQDRMVRTARLFRPEAGSGGESSDVMTGA